MSTLNLETFLHKNFDLSSFHIEAHREENWHLSLRGPNGELAPCIRMRWSDSVEPEYEILVFDALLEMTFKGEANLEEIKARFVKANAEIIDENDRKVTIAYECTRLLVPCVLIIMVNDGNEAAAKQLAIDWNEAFKKAMAHILTLAPTIQ